MSPRFRSFISALLLAVILVTAVGCKAGTTASKSEATPTPIPPPPVPEKATYTVKRGQVVDSLSFTGRVAPSIEDALFFKVSGYVKKVYVERNAVVKKGDVLAELENEDLKRQLSQAQIEFETAQLNLQNANDAKQYAIDKAKIALEIKKIQLAQMEGTTGSSAADLATARANLQRVQAALKQAQTRYDIRAGQGGGVEGSAQALALEQATLDVQIAQANYDKLVNQASDQQKKNAFDLQVMTQNVALAQLDLDYLQKSGDPQLAKAVDRAKLAVDRLQTSVENTRLTSPIDGKVTSVSVYEGRNADAYKPLVVVADESKIEITAEPLSSQLQRLAEGMAAAVVITSYPGKELPAKIKQLPYPYGTGGSTAAGTASDQVDKLTHIDFDPGDLKIETGDLVKVIVTLEQKDNALYLPAAAIRTFGGRKFVVIDESGVQKRVDVTIGIESAERVEIKDGVQENQVIIGQ
jgi:multidrug efflux pump subunit AcrA (membrane-fusion protein)